MKRAILLLVLASCGPSPEAECRADGGVAWHDIKPECHADRSAKAKHRRRCQFRVVMAPHCIRGGKGEWR